MKTARFYRASFVDDQGDEQIKFHRLRRDAVDWLSEIKPESRVIEKMSCDLSTDGFIRFLNIYATDR